MDAFGVEEVLAGQLLDFFFKRIKANDTVIVSFLLNIT